MFVDERPEAEVLGQGGRQQEPRVGHQAVVVKRGGEPVAYSTQSDRPVQGFRSPSVGGREAADARAFITP